MACQESGYVVSRNGVWRCVRNEVLRRLVEVLLLVTLGALPEYQEREFTRLLVPSCPFVCLRGPPSLRVPSCAFVDSLHFVSLRVSSWTPYTSCPFVCLRGLPSLRVPSCAFVDPLHFAASRPHASSSQSAHQRSSTAFRSFSFSHVTTRLRTGKAWPSASFFSASFSVEPSENSTVASCQ
jgi:hypothetical protein